ncbi:MAG: AAA family ATPase [Paludibacter sp.]|nr:AAA family ATPase [Paludibacter sp.]
MTTNDSSVFYDLAKDFALQTNRNIFITGKAGTGKTTFLHNLKNLTRKQMAVVAPTGVAAINAGGVTLHSFFQLPFTPFIPSMEGKKDLMEKIKMRGFKRKILQELELLVIDEISMVRADTLDAIDTLLRQVRFRHKDPFGGVQVIFIGDMFQLSPVVSDEEWAFLSQFYASPYFFHSHVAQQQQPVYIELNKIFRQSDERFIRILNEVRNNCLTSESLQMLQSKYNPLFVPPLEETYITLTTHNYKADRINAEEIDKLPGDTIIFNAKIEGEFNEKSYPTEKELALKIGAKVMLIKNDTETPRRFYNGKIGIIEAFEDDFITIKCPEDRESIRVSRMEWENIRYTPDLKTKKINEEIIGKFTQFPVRLAWAITIHKSQGLTFEKAVIDAGEAFAPGQVYVALSRCRNLEGMVLWSRINPSTIENDREIVEHERLKLPLEALESELDKSRYIFRSYVLRQVFDFTTLTGQFARFSKSIEEVVTSFHDDTMPFLKNIQQQLVELDDIGSKFRHQVENIFHKSEVDEDFLSERLDAAKTFFTGKIHDLTETLKQSPATTDSRENAQNYNDGIKTLFSELSQKDYLLNKLQHPFSVENYFTVKNSFVIPDFTVNAYSKVSAGKTFKVNHPKLYFRLIELRNKICEPDNTPIYLVAGSKTIEEMADFLPLSEKELLQIHGFGKAKVEKFGRQFLEVITDYCLDNNLTSRMYEKSVEEKPKKKRKK